MCAAAYPRGAGRGQGAGGLMASQQDLAEQLLRRTDTDATGARAMLPIDEVADVLVCFHAQQAVEESLKAVLAARGGRVSLHP